MNSKQILGYAVAAATLIAGAIAVHAWLKEQRAESNAAMARAGDPSSALLSGDASFSVGSWLYDQFSPDVRQDFEYEPRKLQVRDESFKYN